MVRIALASVAYIDPVALVTVIDMGADQMLSREDGSSAIMAPA